MAVSKFEYESLILSEDLKYAIAEYRSGVLEEEKLVKVFFRIARLVHRSRPFEHKDLDSLFEDAADFCIERLKKFEKGNAFNYFVTIISCYLRQARRRCKL